MNTKKGQPRVDNRDSTWGRFFYSRMFITGLTGKTTYLYALAQKLSSEGKYIPLVVSFEQAGYRSITVEKSY